MGKISLLDCTLRDGGYLNDWEFGKDIVVSVFERLVSAQIEIIEVGFLNDSREYDENRTILPNTQSVNKIFGKLNKGNSMIVAMIDYGTCDISNIQPSSETCIDGIRVIFKEEKMVQALEYCKQIKDLGYKVFAQLVSVTTYTDKKLLELIEIVNEIEPYAISMVDTYGLLHMDNLMHIVDLLDNNLKHNIALGYHAHNNFQMGYANGITFIEKRIQRDILIDGTLYGMGKSAGNTPLELLAMYLNENYNKNYDIGQILESIESNIIELHRQVEWGYSLFYFVAASTKSHPNYVSYLMNKRTLSMKAITELLNSIEDEKKLLYDEQYIENKYFEYQNMECNDDEEYSKLALSFKEKRILLIGPGGNANKQKERVLPLMENENLIKISINHIPESYEVDYLFLVNSKKYVRICRKLSDENRKKPQIIATTNVLRTQGAFDYVLNYNKLINIEELVPDNSLIMFLKVLIKLGIQEVYLAGFDGYEENEMNVYSTNLEMQTNKGSYMNRSVNRFLNENRDKIRVKFVTDSRYQGVRV